ncbi:MAG: hypothetical protein ACK56F_32930, partial [bacterium]
CLRQRVGLREIAALQIDHAHLEAVEGTLDLRLVGSCEDRVVGVQYVDHSAAIEYALVIP